MSVPSSASSLLSPQTHKSFSSFSNLPSAFATARKVLPSQTVKLFTRSSSLLLSSQHSKFTGQDDAEDYVVGDCIVFEDGIFDDPYLQQDLNSQTFEDKKPIPTEDVVDVEPEDLVPEQWKKIQAEINLTKKERRKIAQAIQFNSRLEKRTQAMLPLRHLNLEDYMTYKEAKLAEERLFMLDSATRSAVKDKVKIEKDESLSERVAPKNPRWQVYGRGLDDVTEFFNSEDYDPNEAKTPGGRRRLFTKEEKDLLNKRKPDLASATSEKWLPLHSLVTSGEFILVDSLLKHDVDINAADKDGFTALHKAILGKKQAITNYLLRNSANPFVRDKDGATLMHYAVQTASSQAIKVLLLYNVDINLADNDGWTPLHLAVQARRTDLVKLLLIKGADASLENKDGLTPLQLCLYSGQDTRTYELIKLLKNPPKPRPWSAVYGGQHSSKS